MATYAGVNTFTEQFGSPVINTSSADTMNVTRTFRGKTADLETFLTDWELGTADDDYPNVFVVSRNSTESGPYTTVTISLSGRNASTDATFAPRNVQEDAKERYKSVDVKKTGIPVTLTYVSKDITVSYFSKTKPGAAASTIASELVTATAAPSIISWSPATVAVPVVTTDYTIQTRGRVSKVKPIGNKASPSEYKVTETWSKMIEAV